MSITRTSITTIASVDVDDDGQVELTVSAGRTERTRVTITPNEAREFAHELVLAAAEATAYLAERTSR